MKKTIIAFFIGLFLQTGGVAVFAQGEELPEDKRSLRQSVDLTYEANSDLVEENFVEAEAKYRKAIAKSQKNTAAPYNLGNAYYNKKSMGEAFMRYKEAGESAETKAERHKVFHNMGNVFMKNKEYQKAVETYKQALRNDPTDEETRYNLALAKEMLEKEQQQNQQNQDDQNQDNQDNKDNQDQQQQQQQDQDQQNQDQQNQDQQEQEGDPNDQGQDQQDKKDEGEGEQEEQQQKKPEQGEGQPQQPRQSQLSPQQIKNILEAMNNEEKKVQEKMNAKKVKGIPVKSEKDW
ncbi:tetratricopeptide repeat protein [Robertkochia marina]|uniref:Tetratricopeptide repeat protein n=1 Tax=Robertkochia marina TaxID=1227945 RepID=A0A4S3M495_9FLAO|nr:tetratricopeptide repeat protein [Robertkochia marina]TRZ47265.1 tetratricopeptide repeat protein [Robertkochia marina]